MSLTFLLFGVAILLLGIDGEPTPDVNPNVRTDVFPLSRATNLLLGVAVLLVGAAILGRAGRKLLLRGAILISSLAALPGGAVFLVVWNLSGDVGQLLRGVALVLVGGSILLAGIGLQTDRRLLASIGYLLAGVAILTISGTFLSYGRLLLASSVLLGGVAILLAGVSTLPGVHRKRLPGMVMLLASGAMLVGTAGLVEESLLGAVATLLTGVALLHVGLVLLTDRGPALNWTRRVARYLQAPVRVDNEPSE
ncbi:hypothetical protein GCM10028784_29920 [Myceligenerans cantabricum]